MQEQGKFYKRDFLQMYGNPEMYVFEEWIADIIDEIGWIKGKKQVFPPRVAHRIFEHLDLPIDFKVQPKNSKKA